MCKPGVSQPGPPYIGETANDQGTSKPSKTHKSNREKTPKHKDVQLENQLVSSTSGFSGKGPCDQTLPDTLVTVVVVVVVGVVLVVVVAVARTNYLSTNLTKRSGSRQAHSESIFVLLKSRTMTSTTSYVFL